MAADLSGSQVFTFYSCREKLRCLENLNFHHAWLPITFHRAYKLLTLLSFKGWWRLRQLEVAELVIGYQYRKVTSIKIFFI